MLSATIIDSAPSQFKANYEKKGVIKNGNYEVKRRKKIEKIRKSR